VDERDVLSAWRNLFAGKPVTGKSLKAAEAMLDGLEGESPLHIRLAGELEELKKRSADLLASAQSNGRRRSRGK
jgi:hypothetical protein